MKEIFQFTAVILLFVICCWTWGPSDVLTEPARYVIDVSPEDAVMEPKKSAETPEISVTPEAPEETLPAAFTDTPEPTVPAEINKSIFAGRGKWFLITGLGLLAAAGSTVLIFQGKKRKNMDTAMQYPDTDAEPDRTRIIPKNGPYECAGCIGQGKRSYQEDSLWYSNQSAPGKPICAIVADGMGGMDNGAESSSIAKEFFKIHVRSLETDRDIPSKLWEISSSINAEVYKANMKKNMNGGTTLVCAYIINNLFYWISIGDSRIYLYRDGMIAAVNEEHELETRLYDMYLDGKISIDELRCIPNHELRKLTSHVGGKAISLIDQNYVPYQLKKGDKIVLCSDGVSGTLSEDDILRCLQDPDPEINCREIKNLIEEKDRKGQDNYSAVVIYCKTEDGK